MTPESIAYYRSILEGMDVPHDRPIPIPEFATLAGITEGTAKRKIRHRLRLAGEWPWPNDPAPRVTDEQILEAATQCNGRIGAIMRAVGRSRGTVKHARRRLRAAGCWPWPNGPCGPLENLRPNLKKETAYEPAR